MIRRRNLTFFVALGAAISCAVAQGGQARPTVVPFKPSGIYELGEKAGWTVTCPEGYRYVVKRNNQDAIQSGEVVAGGMTIEVALREPGMLYMELTAPGSRPLAYGAAVAPTKLKPVVPKPKDFDAFWKGKIAGLKAIPENAVVTPGESYKPEVEYATIQMDHVNGTHVYGQIARPKKPGKYPAVLVLQWASPPYPLQKPWVIEPANQGFIALNIEPHDVLPNAEPSYYQGLPTAIKNYASIGQDDRERSYFVEMYLRDYRAADYLSKLPDWDGKTLLVMGTSMGGQQSLAVAGLHPKITHLIVNEPAGCDLNAGLHGRQQGYPFFAVNDAKTMEAARYVDAVNFAPGIKARSLVAMGFVDNIAPPAGIWTAFNLIKGPKEAAPMVDSPHNNLATPEQQRPYTQRSAEWMAALAHGAQIGPASQGAPRTDANSRAAHVQMVEKARKGGIDLYFVGDSITRRWGTSDAAYAPFLANWRANFFGWNAGNFGWGADTAANVLWRLENGELDGVNPKAIVVMAGTNDIGGGASADAVVRGVKAILDVCRKKAPKATIVLTAIMPRSDHQEVVLAANEGLAKLADGKRVRFLNVNDRLADPSGKPREGVTVDGLHPSVTGYQIWADGLKPILTEILGPPAKIDHAPPPTGDPSAASKPPR